MSKVFIISGGNRGLGNSLVNLILELSETVVISISRTKAESQNGESPKRFYFIKADLADGFDSSIFDEAKGLLFNTETIYFINNASVILPITKIGKLIESDISNSLKVNIDYPIKLVNFLMRNYSSKKLVFVNISSGVAHKPIACWSLYGACKASMFSFFKTLELENKDSDNIRVYNIDPGVLDTRMQLEIRNSDFPDKEHFYRLETENKLINTNVAAKDIFKQIGLVI